jgi:hypothetical protein
MKAFTFLLLNRTSGRKWIATAGTDSGDCLSGAEQVFSLRGLRGETAFASVVRQKNFAGFSPDFREVSATDRELKLHWLRDYREQWPDEPLAHLIETFPHAQEFTATGELS